LWDYFRLKTVVLEFEIAYLSGTKKPQIAKEKYKFVSKFNSIKWVLIYLRNVTPHK
jgi:hypothetical protein